MARLDKKNDARLSSYFRDFLAMCKRVCGRPDDDEAIHGLLQFKLIIGLATAPRERLVSCLSSLHFGHDLVLTSPVQWPVIKTVF